MQREVIKWLQSLDLSTTVKNPRRDLANGFTPAEIISRYADESALSMHSISTGVSTDTRRNNWRLVVKALKKLRCATVTDELVDAVLRLQPNAAVAVLENLYEFFVKRPLPLRSMDAYGGNGAYMHPRDAATARVLLETIGEVPDGQIPSTDRHGAAEGYEYEDDNDSSEYRRTAYVAATQVQEHLALTQNPEVAGGIAPLRELPRYTRPTAAALLHAANGPRQDVALGADKYARDEALTTVSNARIVEQHNILQRAIREEPAGGSGGGERRGSVEGRAPLTTVLRGPYSTARLNRRRVKRRAADEAGDDPHFSSSISSAGGGTTARKVEVSVLGDALCMALERNGVLVHGGQRALEKSVEAFESCGFDIRKGISNILKDVLAAHHDLVTLVELSGGNSEGDILEDLLTSVLAHRDVLPTVTLEACWTALGQNAHGIAAAVERHPASYHYLIQALGYIFSLEAAQVPLLHVSALAEQVNGAASSTGVAAPSPASLPNRHHRSQSIGHALLVAARRESLAPTAEADTVNKPQQAVFSDTQAFHLASGFVFLSKVTEALASTSPAVSQRVLVDYFLPAANRALVPCGTTAVVEAVARVIVASMPPKNSADNDAKADAAVAALLSDHVRSVLTGMTPGSAVSADERRIGRFRTTSAARREQRWYLVLYHALRQISDTQGQESTAPLLPTPHGGTWAAGESGTPTLAMRAQAAVLRCLTSEDQTMQCIGVALLNQLTVWNALSEALPLTATMVMQPILRPEHPSAFLSADSGQWELRTITLELLTVTFRKVVAILAERAAPGVCQHPSSMESGDEVQSPEPSCDVSTRAAADTSPDLLSAFSLSSLDIATERCLRTFQRAPHTHRQLALSVVGRRLLADYQPRTASTWLRLLLSFSPETFRRCLLPYEDRPLQMSGRNINVATTPTAPGAGIGSVEPSRPSGRRLTEGPKSGLSFVHQGGGGTRSMSAARSAAGTTATSPLMRVVTWNRGAARGGGAPSALTEVSSASASSIRVLVGAVESAYMVAPLNQSWNTFGVVQLMLQRLDKLRPFECLSITAAALLSPQLVDVQQGQLLSDLRLALLPRDEGGPPSPSSDACESVGSEHDFAVTLRELTMTQTDDTAGGNTKDAGNADDGGSLSIQRRRHWGEGTPAAAESLTRAFWTSTLHRLLPMLLEAVHSEAAQDGDSDEEIHDDDDEASQLKQIGVAVLLTLFRRYAPPAVVASGVHGPELLERALHWAAEQTSGDCGGDDAAPARR